MHVFQCTTQFPALPDDTPLSVYTNGPSPRLCHLRRWEGFQGYGFNLQSEKGKPGQRLGAIDAQSPGECVGLLAGDHIIEVNGINIMGMKHAEVVQQVGSKPNKLRD